MSELAYRRVLLKLSGEALMGAEDYGIDPVVIGRIAREIMEVREAGAEIGLVIGGALSNILDRARHGAVTDFLDLHLAAYHWPAFNLADVAVVTGTALLLLDGLRDAKRKAATGL